jgi:hypothetical protein
LDEVHRLIEGRRWRFALTGSSALPEPARQVAALLDSVGDSQVT